MYINRLQDLLRREARLSTVVQTLAPSHLNYGITVWGTTNITQLRRIQRIQNFAAKVVTGGAKFDRVTKLWYELQWPNIEQKCIFEQCIIVFKAPKKHFPGGQFSFPRVRQIVDTNTGLKTLLYVQKHTLTLGPDLLQSEGQEYGIVSKKVKKC